MAPSQSQLANHVEFLQEKTNLWLDGDDAQSRQSLREAALKLANALEQPVDVSERLFYEPVSAMCLNIALEGNWLQYLAKQEGPVSVLELCRACGGSPGFVVRIMRVLVLQRMVDEHDAEVYRANDTTHYLVGTAIMGVTDHIYPLHARAYLQMPKWARENGYEEPKNLENGPFAAAFNKTFWQVLEETPTANSAFTNSMDFYYDGSVTNTDAEFLHNDVMKNLGSKDTTITVVDIGGGSGAFHKAFQSMFPKTQARLITQDRPSVVEEARKQRDAEGLEYLGYDFFTPQPVKGAHGYTMRHIIHDWPEEPAQKILQNTAMSMDKNSRFYIFDTILPDRDYTEAAVYLDLLMMASFSGKERTRSQWDKLLAAAGLKLVDTVILEPPTALGVIVAALAD